MRTKKYKPLNNCLDCKHFHFDSGSPGYSEETPGSNMRIGCNLSVWNAGYMYSENDFKKAMLSATNCEMYEPQVNDV